MQSPAVYRLSRTIGNGQGTIKICCVLNDRKLRKSVVNASEERGHSKSIRHNWYTVIGAENSDRNSL